MVRRAQAPPLEPVCCKLEFACTYKTKEDAMQLNPDGTLSIPAATLSTEQVDQLLRGLAHL